jgi:hypothetical protein
MLINSAYIVSVIPLETAAARCEATNRPNCVPQKINREQPKNFAVFVDLTLPVWRLRRVIVRPSLCQLFRAAVRPTDVDKNSVDPTDAL